MTDKLYVATQSGSAEVDGEAVVFHKGVTMVAEGHPLLQAVPDYFTPAEESAGFGTATVKFEATETEIAEWEAKKEAEQQAAEAAEELLAMTPEERLEYEAEQAKAEAAANVNATEAAVALAEEHNIDLSTVEGTGTDGRITQPDVARLIEAS